MINFDPSIGAIAPNGKVGGLSLVETLLSPQGVTINQAPKKASGFEGDRDSTSEPKNSDHWNSTIAAMDRINILGAAWNAVFSIAQQVPETFKKLMNN